jgi:hypothetical protein
MDIRRTKLGASSEPNPRTSMAHEVFEQNKKKLIKQEEFQKSDLFMNSLTQTMVRRLVLINEMQKTIQNEQEDVIFGGTYLNYLERNLFIPHLLPVFGATIFFMYWKRKLTMASFGFISSFYATCNELYRYKLIRDSNKNTLYPEYMELNKDYKTLFQMFLKRLTFQDFLVYGLGIDWNLKVKKEKDEIGIQELRLFVHI